jgi:hypothetical protein
MKRKQLLLVVALASTLFASWWAAGLDDESASGTEGHLKRGERAAPRRARGNGPQSDLAMLDSVPTPIKAEGAPLFAVHSFQPPPAADLKPQKPTAPPLPFRYLGGIEDNDGQAVFLTDGGRTYVAHSGDTLDGRYRVAEITPQQVTLVFLPLAQQQILATGRTQP